MSNKKKILKYYNFILLDLDGVIFNSKNNMRLSWNLCRKKFNINQPFDQYFMYLGLPINDILKNLKIKSNFKNIINYYQKHSNKNLKKIKLYKGVKTTLDFLKRKKIKFSIITSKNKKRSVALLKMNKIQPNSVHCASKIKPGKPSPFLINEAIRKNRMKYNQTCFIGDTEIDYKAAKKANVDFIYAAYGYGQKKNYKTKINTFKDILRFIKIQ